MSRLSGYKKKVKPHNLFYTSYPSSMRSIKMHFLHFCFVLLFFLSAASEASSSPPRVSVMTQNVYFIAIAPIDPKERIPYYINYLASSNYDIVCLQEVFSSLTNAGFVNLLVDGLEDVYPYNVKLQPQSFDNAFDSGLLILSKYPIPSFAFHKFISISGVEAWADKGCIMAHVQIPLEGNQTSSLVITNTHFNAFGFEVEVVRQNQTMESVAALEDFLETLKSNQVDISQVPVLALGDFNINERQMENTTLISSEYTQLLENLGDETQDLYRVANGDEPRGFTYLNPPLRLDYIFGLSGSYTVVEAGVDDFVLTATNTFNLSDHLAAYAVIEIDEKSRNEDSGGFGCSKGIMILAFAIFVESLYFI